MTVDQPSRSRRPKSTTLVVIVLLTALPWVVYLPVRSFEFLDYDDDVYVTANPRVAQGITAESISWTLTSPQHGNWHPLTMISHMLDVEIWGMDPSGHHLTSVAIHSISGALLFLFLWRLTGRRWPSALVAALFAVHPLNVQSVAWVAERKNVLSTLVWFLALLAYLPYMRRPTVRRYALVAVLFVLGLAAKSVVVTLPLTLLILDWWSRQDDAGLSVKRTGSYGRLFVEKTPLLLGSLACGLATMWAQTKSGAMEASEMIPLGLRLGNAVVAYTWYLRKAIWPTELSAFYPHPVHTLEAWKIVLSGTVLIAITALVLRAGRRQPYLIAGWAWYVITLAPMAGIVQVGSQAQADRYSYIPLIGIFVAVVWTLADFLAERGRAWVVAGSVVGSLVVIGLAWNAHWNLAFWRNGLVLFERAVEIDPDNMIARGNYGVALADAGSSREAETQFREVLKIDPAHAKAHYNLGNLHRERGALDLAEAEYRAALRTKPTHAQSHLNLGLVMLATGRIPQAEESFRRANEVLPDNVDAMVNLANVLRLQGRGAESVPLYVGVLALEPRSTPARLGLAQAELESGRYDEGLERLRGLVADEPDLVEAHFSLAIELDRRGRYELAQTEYLEVLRLDPGNERVRMRLGLQP